MSASETLLKEMQQMEIAAELHLVVRNRLKELTDAEPQIEDVGQILARTFGDICGLYAVKGKAADIPALNARAEKSASDMIRELTAASCGGRA